jgi:GNAT superfamily N-acetyltransferase
MSGIDISFDPARIERALDRSLTVSAFVDAEQQGFCRAITDYATFAYLCDLFVAPAVRGRGLASAMLRTLAAHPELIGLRRTVLVTRDAHPLYLRFGFTPLTSPARWMERLDSNVYRKELTV